MVSYDVLECGFYDNELQTQFKHFLLNWCYYMCFGMEWKRNLAALRTTYPLDCGLLSIRAIPLVVNGSVRRVCLRIDLLGDLHSQLFGCISKCTRIEVYPSLSVPVSMCTRL
jgi:hypothetical protein